MLGDDELIQLKTVYDELWQDAKTMIKDVTRSIKAVAWVGYMLFIIAFLQFFSAHQIYMKIVEGSTRMLDYFYLITISLGVIILIVAGVFSIRGYYKLKNRYKRIIQLEKKIGD